MRLVFLGTGWLNAPLIGKPKWNDETMGIKRQKIRRGTPAIVIQPDGPEGASLLIDAGAHITDQWDAWNDAPAQPDALIITHSHIDHIGGIADLTHCVPPLPTYGTEVTLERIISFGNAVHPTPDYRMRGLDRRKLPVNGVTDICGTPIQTIPLNHAGPTVPDTAILIRHNNTFIAHLSDTAAKIEPELKDELVDVDLLIINTPSFHEMDSHIGVQNAIDLSYEVNAKHLILTHINYDMDPDALSALEREHPHITVASDGLVADVNAAENGERPTITITYLADMQPSS